MTPCSVSKCVLGVGGGGRGRGEEISGPGAVFNEHVHELC